MEIDKIKQIIDMDIADSFKESLILKHLALDKKSLTTMLEVIHLERMKNDELIKDMNHELSRAHIYIDERPEVKSEEKQQFNKNFITDAIAKFYYKYKGVIDHCYNRFT